MDNGLDNNRDWILAKDKLVTAIKQLGFPAELGEQVAKQLGSPKAMERMYAYLCYVKPHSAELIVDEMLAICSEIDAWKRKKAAEAANAKYNELLYYGLDTDPDSDTGQFYGGSTDIYEDSASDDTPED